MNQLQAVENSEPENHDSSNEVDIHLGNRFYFTTYKVSEDGRPREEVRHVLSGKFQAKVGEELHKYGIVQAITRIENGYVIIVKNIRNKSCLITVSYP